jgi:hypothetical protein
MNGGGRSHLLRAFLTIGLVLALTASDAWCAALCGAQEATASVETQPSCHDAHPGAARRSASDAAKVAADAPGLAPASGHGAPSGAPCDGGCAGCEAGRPSVNPAPANVEVTAPDAPAAPALPVFRRASDPLRRPAARAPAPPEPRTSRDVLARTSTLLL